MTEKQDKPVGFEMAQPVAWRFKDPKDGHWLYTTHLVDLSKKYWRLKNELFDPLYITPPAPSKRKWVGLEAEDLAQIESDEFWQTGNHMAIAMAVEAKLKERNT